MKKFKCGLSLVLALIMSFSVFSFGSFAAADKEIDTLELSFDAKPGDSFADAKELTTILTEGVDFADSLEELTVAVIGGDELFEGTFEMGETYYIIFMLEPKDGYSFPDSEDGFKSVKVNGVEATEVIIQNIDILNVAVSVTGVVHELAMGGTIEAVDALLNVYGDMAVADWYRYLTVSSMGVQPYGDMDAVKAYDMDGNPVLGDFVTGQEYRVEIFLTAKKNCVFNKDANGETQLNSVSINGEQVSYSVGTYQYEGDEYEYLKLETTVTAKEPKYITSVDITISENLEGMPVYVWENYITINTPGVKFVEEYDAVDVFDYFGNWVYDSFEEGNIYDINIYLTTEEGYFFPDYGALESVKVNGVETDDYIAGEDNLGIFTQADLVGDGFFAQLMFFFKKIVAWFQNLFFGMIIF